MCMCVFVYVMCVVCVFLLIVSCNLKFLHSFFQLHAFFLTMCVFVCVCVCVLCLCVCVVCVDFKL